MIKKATTLKQRLLCFGLTISLIFTTAVIPSKKVHATEYQNVKMTFTFDDATGYLKSIYVSFDITGANSAVAEGKWGIGIFECDFSDNATEKDRVKSVYGLTDISKYPYPSGQSAYGSNAYSAARSAPAGWSMQTLCTTSYTQNKCALLTLPVAYGAGKGSWPTGNKTGISATINMSGATFQKGKTYYAHIMMNNGRCWFVESSGTKGYNGNTFTIDTIHTHNWAYTQSGDTLSVYCNQSKGRAYCDSYGTANKKSITLRPDTPFYSGSGVTTGWRDNQTISFSLDGTNVWKTAVSSVPTIYYEGRTPTTYNKSTVKPTTEGTYRASISAGTAVAYIDFEIKRLRTVSFSPGIGNGTMSDIEIRPGPYTLPSCEFESPPYMYFEGWSTSLRGEIIETEAINISNDITLYAKWRMHNHFIRTVKLGDAAQKEFCECGYYIIRYDK